MRQLAQALLPHFTDEDPRPWDVEWLAQGHTAGGYQTEIGTQAFLLLVQCFLLRCVASEIKMHVGSFLGDEEVCGEVP